MRKAQLIELYQHWASLTEEAKQKAKNEIIACYDVDKEEFEENIADLTQLAYENNGLEFVAPGGSNLAGDVFKAFIDQYDSHLIEEFVEQQFDFSDPSIETFILSPQTREMFQIIKDSAPEVFKEHIGEKIAIRTIIALITDCFLNHQKSELPENIARNQDQLPQSYQNFSVTGLFADYASPKAKFFHSQRSHRKEARELSDKLKDPSVNKRYEALLAVYDDVKENAGFNPQGSFARRLRHALLMTHAQLPENELLAEGQNLQQAIMSIQNISKNPVMLNRWFENQLTPLAEEKSSIGFSLSSVGASGF
ncbi:hypothetical protein E3983_12025 [Legionella israelensis]|uniref:Uncharacterized protein n=1 Tax=Legionella israelensis TaxID=454 RepID=A0AAX1EIM4_9GAMM|nr:hypothetical protein [Legionella israelensis]QBR85016.1 hypothetical protein E3983_12025 [Legionella israelensis]